jgi:hypothetical protein
MLTIQLIDSKTGAEVGQLRSPIIPEQGVELEISRGDETESFWVEGVLKVSYRQFSLFAELSLVELAVRPRNPEIAAGVAEIVEAMNRDE